MKNTIKLDNPVQINGKSYNELTYDISEITAQALSLIHISRSWRPSWPLARAASPSCAPATIWNATPRHSWLHVAS